MKIIASLPPPYRIEDMKAVAANPAVSEFRFNTGVKVPDNPEETLRKILEYVPADNVIIDVKGPQTRIIKWSLVPYGVITLNHKIEVDLPAIIRFRGGDISEIVAVRGNKIYVSPSPQEPVGDGQAVNIIGANFRIKGRYTSALDRKYLEAGRNLGINKYMLSFFESARYISEVARINPVAKNYLKIETLPGIRFVEENFDLIKGDVHLVAALDDLYENIGDDKTKILEMLFLIIRKDPQAIAASRLLTSLEKEREVSFSDIASFQLLRQMGYENFMLSDGVCYKPRVFEKAVEIMQKF